MKKVAGTFPGKVPATFFEFWRAIIGNRLPAHDRGRVMRHAIAAFILPIAAGISAYAAQKPEDGAMLPSKKGEVVIIRGCVSGSLLKDLRAQKTESVTGGESAVVYRLTGDKKLLQIIQKEHQEQVLDVTGQLASNTSVSSTTRSKQMGKARVYVGAGHQETSDPAKPPTYPSLHVTAFEAVRPTCR